MTPLIPYKDLCSKYTPEQYKQSSRLLGIINAILKQCDDLEIAFFEILQALSLADAMGPALDYLGAIVGISRNVGEDDESYRVRIGIGRSLVGLPTPEALRRVLQFITGKERIGLFPDYPAGLYFVVDGFTTVDFTPLEGESMTSGASLARGTFLIGEYTGDEQIAEAYYVVNEDNGMPFVIDCHPFFSGYELTTENDVALATENDEILIVE